MKRVVRKTQITNDASNEVARLTAAASARAREDGAHAVAMLSSVSARDAFETFEDAHSTLMAFHAYDGPEDVAWSERAATRDDAAREDAATRDAAAQADESMKLSREASWTRDVNVFAKTAGDGFSATTLPSNPSRRRACSKRRRSCCFTSRRRLLEKSRRLFCARKAGVKCTRRSKVYHDISLSSMRSFVAFSRREKRRHHFCPGRSVAAVSRRRHISPSFDACLDFLLFRDKSRRQ